jgi:hypothetical protein
MCQHGESSDPIDQGVVQLEHESGLFPVDAVDDDRFPGWELWIESGRTHHLSDVQNVSERRSAGQRDAREVEIKVELRVFDELRPAPAQGANDGM